MWITYRATNMAPLSAFRMSFEFYGGLNDLFKLLPLLPGYYRILIFASNAFYFPQGKYTA